MHRLRPRLTYANVVSTLCLFILLGGTAWAVAANSVGTAQLKDGAVTNPKLAADSVGTKKVFNGSLLKQDFKAGQVPRGALSFNKHVTAADYKTHCALDDACTIDGIRLQFSCSTPQNPAWYLAAVKSGDTVLVSGTRWYDSGAVRGTNRADNIVVFASSETDVSVIASAASVGKWTRFDLGTYGANGACNFWGLVTPPSN
jgi:hypothetical protein